MQHGAQVRPGALPHEHHVAPVPSISFDVLHDPADSSADILDHVRDEAAGKVAVVDTHQNHTEVHQLEPQLRIVGAVADDEGAAHDADHNWYLCPLAMLRVYRLLGDVHVQVLA